MRPTSIFYCGAFIFFASVYIWLSYFAAYPNVYEDFLNTHIQFVGTIESDPVQQKYGQTFMARPVNMTQNILLKAPRGNYFYGDEIYAQGLLRPIQNKNDFDYADYLKIKNVYAQMNSGNIFVLSTNNGNPFIYYILQFKHFLFEQINASLSKDLSPIMIAFISGEKNLLSSDQLDFFKNTGSIHLIAVSGFKLTLLLISIDYFKKYFGRKTVWINFCVILTYLVFANFAAAVLRAAIMNSIYIYCKQNGRRYNQLAILTMTAIILVEFNPLILKYDIGFLLSFLGIAGIVILSPPINFALRFIPENYFKEIFISTFAAQLATFPLQLIFFKEISLISPLANILTLPLLTPTIILGYLCAVPYLRLAAAILASMALNYVYSILNFLSTIPYTHFAIAINQIELIIIYVIEIVLYLLVLKILKKRAASVNIRA